jgi:hypothetical protein
MIVRSTRERYGGGFLVVQYEPDESGRCAPRVTESAFDDQIDTYFAQQAEILQRMEARVLAGEISPLALFMELNRMTVVDAAARLRLRRSAVRAHLTPRGFRRARVETLERYARLFDVSVADFFHFTHLEDDLAFQVAHSPGRVVQRLDVTREP